MARRQIKIFFDEQQAAGGIKKLTAERRKLTNEIYSGLLSEEDYIKAVKKVNELNPIIEAHKNQIRGVQSTWDKLGKGLRSVTALAGVSLGAEVLVSYGKELFRTGVQMDALNRKAATVFGDTLPQVTEEAKKNAAAMGLTTAQYVAQAASIQDLLIPMGFQRKEAADITVNLTNLSGALSEWTGGQKTSEEVAQTLSKALLGEREELKGLGISILDADVKARLAQKGLAGLTGQALEQAKAMATLELITEKSTDAQKAYAENSDTLIRQQAELTSKFQNIKESLSIALIPAFNRLLDVAGGFINVVEDISGANQKASESVSELQAQFNIEIETLKRGNLTQENRNKLIDEINKKYSSYLPNLITEKDSYEDLTAAQAAANEKFVERITLLAAEEKFQAVQSRRLDAVTRQLELEKKLSEAEADRANNRQVTGIGGINTREGQVKGITELIRQNQKAQEDLQKEFDETAAAAAKLGVDITKALTGGSTPTAGGGGGGGGGDNKAAERARKEREKEAERRRKEAEKQAEDELQLRQKLAEEAASAEVEAENGRNEDELTRLEDFAQRKFETQQELDEFTNEYLLSEYERQLLQAEKHYQDLLFLADQYGLDKTALEEAYLSQINNILLEQNEKELDETQKSEEKKKALRKKELEDQAKNLNELGNAVGSFGASLGSVYDLLGEKNYEATALSKTLAVTEIAIATAEAIAKGVAASQDVPFPGNIAAIATTVAAVLANIATATKILQSAPAVPQKKKGGWLDVVGADDGITYNAKYIGQPLTGMLPDHPVLLSSVTGGDVLASERGREYFVSNTSLSHPVVFNHVRAIDNIVKHKQMASGGFTTTTTATVATAPLPPAGDMTIMIGLKQSIDRLNTNLESGIVAVVDNDFIRDLRAQERKLNRAAGQ